MNPRIDTFALVLGLLAGVLAVGGLWLAFGGNLDWSTVKVAAPVILVLIGIIGLAGSRGRRSR